MTAERYMFEILNGQGNPFILRDRAWTLDELRADKALVYILSQYRHRAWTEAGDELDGLPGIPQASRLS